MHRYLRLFSLTALGLGAPASNAQTPPPAIDGPVYVATYVEVLPNAVKDATALLKQYRDATRKDAGNQRAEVVHEANRPTRFVVLTIWGDRSEEHTFELQSHSFISYAVFCLKKT